MPASNPIQICPGCNDPAARRNLPVEQQCSACRKKERNRVWREQNPGAMAANARRWRNAGNKSVRPEGYAEQHRQDALARYRDDPNVRERVKATAAKRRREKPEEVKAALKAWRENNREAHRGYLRDYARNRRNTDPEYRQRCLDAQSMWRLRNWAKDTQSDSWVRHTENQAIDPTWRSRLHVWQANCCYLCNAPSDRLTIEHLIPRSRGGPTIKQNIVYSCSSCNYSRQHRMWWSEWIPRSTTADTDGFLLRYRTISAALKSAELGGQPTADGAFMLDTSEREQRPLYVLSTFSCSERNPGSSDGRVACMLHAAHPDAIVLFDHEWYGRQHAVLNMLRSKMGIATRQPGARKLDIVEVQPNTATEFLRANHVMGSIDAAYRIGLADGDRLCGLGVFADHNNSYECVRLAFDGHVAGGMSRIVQGLWRLRGKRPISTFIDTRYATGDGHDGIGFSATGETPETYRWVFPDRVQHQRYLSNDNKMSRSLLYFDPELSRDDNIHANGVFRIWMPGRLKMLLEP